MKGYDCVILEAGVAAPVVSLVKNVFEGNVVTASITVDELLTCDVSPGGEIGTIVVPFDAETDLSQVEVAVRRCRAMGGKLDVLGIASCSKLAARKSLDDVFDDIMSIEWVSAPDVMRSFIRRHQSDMQNRAFKAFLDNSVDGYWIWHIESDVVEWSDRTRDMVQLHRDQVPGSIGAFTELMHPHDRDRVQQAINNHFERDAPYKNIEMRLKKGDGSYGHFLANGQALRDETGKPILLVGSLTDRTLMQKVEQQLEDTQKRFTVLFHHMNDAAVLAEVETGTIVEANQPAERLWKRSINELVGMHQSQLHPPNLSEEAVQAFESHIKALMQNKRDTIYVPIMRADGVELPAEISSSLIEIDGKMMILGVFRDISERVRAEQDIRERDAQIQMSSHLASMGTLAAGVAHEINNPLTYVLGNLEMVKVLLEDKKSSRAEILEAIEAASTGGRYVREIVADLKAISRMDASDSVCDPCEVLRIASRMAMSDLRHRATLEMNLNDVPQVPISSARLSQVVLNLLSNAARAFPTVDRSANIIRIDAHSTPEFVKVVIEDNGQGISSQDLKRVWEPFFTKRGQTGGTGLGLAICRRILHEVGGTLELESEQGVGTKVTITLPVAEQSEQPSLPQLETEANAGKERLSIMVVDDDTLVTTLIDRMLRDEYEITVFNDAREALANLSGGARYDMVLCDLMMPEMDGRTFHTKVRENCPGRCNFLFITGGAVTAQNIEFEKEMAANGRLMHKPFEASELRYKISEVLSQLSQGEADDACDVGNADAPVGGKPVPAVLCELEELLGRDMLRAQYGQMLQQMTEFDDKFEAFEADQLAQEAHKVAGAADVMGLRGIGQCLRDCQHAAASGDLQAAKASAQKLAPLKQDFQAFLEAF